MFYMKIFFVVVLAECALAEDMENLKQEYAALLMKCATEFPITMQDIQHLKDKQMPDSEAVRCLFACAYKKSGMMDDRGMLSVEGVNNLARVYLAEDAQRLQQAEEFTDACKYVNDAPVSDGDKGCDRAALIFKCSIEKTSEFGIGF